MTMNENLWRKINEEMSKENIRRKKDERKVEWKNIWRKKEMLYENIWRRKDERLNENKWRKNDERKVVWKYMKKKGKKKGCMKIC